MTPRELLRDACGVAGVLLVGAGFWQIHRGVALIIAGAMLFAVALYVMRRRT